MYIRFPEQINERSEIEIEPIRAVAGPYRHVRVQEKRKSQVSYSVAGHDLRRKIMRTEGERSQTVRVLQSDLLSDTEEEEVVLETEMLPDTSRGDHKRESLCFIILYYILYYIIYSTLTISKKIKDLSYCIKSTHCITWWYIRLDIKKSNIALHDKMFFIHFEISTMAISQKKIYRITFWISHRMMRYSISKNQISHRMMRYSISKNQISHRMMRC